MSAYVLLTDDDNGTALIKCEDHAEAERVASAAVFSDGGVSAWLVPETAIIASERVTELLRDGENCAGLEVDDLPTVDVGVYVRGAFS